MCLFNASRVYIAKEDLIVYKHVIKCKDGYVTSYQKAEVKFDVVYTSGIELIEKHRHVRVGLHSFANEDDARMEADHYREVLVECRIPKGSRYHKGIFDAITNNTASTIVSNQLIYVKEIMDFGSSKKKLYPMLLYAR